MKARRGRNRVEGLRGREEAEQGREGSSIGRGSAADILSDLLRIPLALLHHVNWLGIRLQKQGHFRLWMLKKPNKWLAI